MRLNGPCVSLCVAISASSVRSARKSLKDNALGETGGDPTSRIPAHESTAVAAPFRA